MTQIPFFKFDGKSWKPHNSVTQEVELEQFSLTVWNILFKTLKEKYTSEKNLEIIKKGVSFSEKEMEEIHNFIKNDPSKDTFEDFLSSKSELDRKVALILIETLKISNEKAAEYIRYIPKDLLMEVFKFILLWEMSNNIYFTNQKLCKDLGLLFHSTIETKIFNIQEAVAIFGFYQTSSYNQAYLIDHHERFKLQAQELKELNSDVIILCEFQIQHLQYLMEQDWVQKNYYLSEITFDGVKVENYTGKVSDMSFILTKLPFKGAYQIIDKHGSGKGFIQLKLWNDFSIFGCHLMAYDERQEIRKKQLNDIISFDSKFIIGGDFNIHNEVDEENLLKLDIYDFKKVYENEKEYFTFDGANNSLVDFIYLYVERRRMPLDRIISNKDLKFKPEFIKFIGTKEHQFGKLKAHLSDHFGLHTLLKRVN